MIGAGALHGPAIGERRVPESVEKFLALHARRQGHHDVACVDALTGWASQATGVEEAEEQVKEIGMRLLHLVDEEDAPGALEGGE